MCLINVLPLTLLPPVFLPSFLDSMWWYILPQSPWHTRVSSAGSRWVAVAYAHRCKWTFLQTWNHTSSVIPILSFDTFVVDQISTNVFTETFFTLWLLKSEAFAFFLSRHCLRCVCMWKKNSANFSFMANAVAFTTVKIPQSYTFNGTGMFINLRIQFFQYHYSNLYIHVDRTKANSMPFVLGFWNFLGMSCSPCLCRLQPHWW